MEWKDIDKKDLLFTHFDDKTGKQTVYNTSRLEDWCKENAIIFLLPITKEDARYLCENRGVEDHRLKRLADIDIGDLPPLIFCEMEDGETWLLVDGTHRYIHLAMVCDQTTAKAYMLKREEYEPFIVHNAPLVDPTKMLKGRSGL